MVIAVILFASALLFVSGSHAKSYKVKRLKLGFYIHTEALKLQPKFWRC